MERSFANTIMTDKLPISHDLTKPQASVKESEQPEFTATSRYYRPQETTITKTPPKKFPQKFTIPETPLLCNISETSQVAKSFIPKTPHQKRNWLSCSTVPETPLLDINPATAEYFEKQPETPVAQMKNKEKDNRERCARNWGNIHVQVVPETPMLKLKSTHELSLYD